MTPETRAKALIRELTLGPDWSVGERLCVDIAASAIRTAENEAIERCYREIMMTALANDGQDAHHEFINGLAVAADQVRNLKHKEP